MSKEDNATLVCAGCLLCYCCRCYCCRCCRDGGGCVNNDDDEHRDVDCDAVNLRGNKPATVDNNSVNNRNEVRDLFVLLFCFSFGNAFGNPICDPFSDPLSDPICDPFGDPLSDPICDPFSHPFSVLLDVILRDTLLGDRVSDRIRNLYGYSLVYRLGHLDSDPVPHTNSPNKHPSQYNNEALPFFNVLKQ